MSNFSKNELAARFLEAMVSRPGNREPGSIPSWVDLAFEYAETFLKKAETGEATKIDARSVSGGSTGFIGNLNNPLYVHPLHQDSHKPVEHKVHVWDGGKYVQVWPPQPVEKAMEGEGLAQRRQAAETADQKCGEALKRGLVRQKVGEIIKIDADHPEIYCFPFGEIADLKEIARDLAVALSALKMSKGQPLGVIAEAVDDALNAYDEWSEKRDEDVVKVADKIVGETAFNPNPENWVKAPIIIPGDLSRSGQDEIVGQILCKSVVAGMLANGIKALSLTVRSKPEGSELVSAYLVSSAPPACPGVPVSLSSENESLHSEGPVS
jgi:hypothetical protein